MAGICYDLYSMSLREKKRDSKLSMAGGRFPKKMKTVLLTHLRYQKEKVGNHSVDIITSKINSSQRSVEKNAKYEFI